MKKVFLILTLFTALAYTGCSKDSEASIDMNESNTNNSDFHQKSGGSVYCNGFQANLDLSKLGVSLTLVKPVTIYFCCGGPFALPSGVPPGCKFVSKATYDLWTGTQSANVDSGVHISEIIKDSDLVSIEGIESVTVKNSTIIDGIRIKPMTYPVDVDGYVHFEFEKI
jgi:hypothetical protein